MHYHSIPALIQRGYPSRYPLVIFIVTTFFTALSVQTLSLSVSTSEKDLQNP